MLNNENIPSFEVDGETSQPEVSAGIYVGIENHKDLKGRDLPNQHPISAITGLQEALDSKAEDGDFVTKEELDKKQDIIEDLETIRTNATAGKNASDTIMTYGDVVTHNVNEFATTAQGVKADNSVQKTGTNQMDSGANIVFNDNGFVFSGIKYNKTFTQSKDGLAFTSNGAAYIDGVQTQATYKALFGVDASYAPVFSISASFGTGIQYGASSITKYTPNENGSIKAVTGSVAIPSKFGTIALTSDLDKYRTASAQDEIDTAIREAIPTNNNQLANGSGYITESALSPYAKTSDVNTELSGKQDNISDLDTIRSGAEKGATAVQPTDIPVKDVQVNGTTVLADGVANIPIASVNNLGVVKVNPTRGLGSVSSGDLVIISATEAEITDKTNNNKPISPKKLDYAVKVGVTTNTNTLTDNEKVTACNWLGAGQQRTTVLDSTTPTITLDNALANTDYQYGTITSLTITSVEESYLETNFYFTAGSEITVDLPDTLKIIGTPSFEANKQYAMSICNNTLIVGTIS